MGRARTHPLRRRITAAAQLDPRGVAGVLPQRSDARRAWDLYRRVPELQAATEWIANAVSRAELYIGRRQPDGSVVRDDDERANRALRDLFGGTATQGTLLKRMVIHLEAQGETYLAQYRDPSTGQMVWTAASSEELRSFGTEIEIQVDAALWVRVEGKLIRIWHRDPVYSWLAESPVVAMETVLKQIISLTERAHAINESRLAGNGILPISENISVLTPSSDGTANPVHDRDIHSAMDEAFIAPITDRGLAGSVAPLILVGPKEDLPTKDSFIRLDSPLDERAVEQLEQALRRMAISMSLPPELVLGLGESNHWNAFIIRDEAVTTTIEPRADVFASGLTTAYLRPLLGRGSEDLVIGVDLNDLVVKPDRSDAAAEARRQGLITDEAYARYQGFAEDDIADGQERKRMLLERLINSDPSTAPWLLPEIGITVPGFTVDSGGQGEQVGLRAIEPSADEAEPDSDGGGSSVGDDPGMPERPQAASAAGTDAAALDSEELLVTAVELAALRVLEHAGNRLIATMPRTDERRNMMAIHAHTKIPVGAQVRAKVLKGSYDLYEDRFPGIVPIVDNYVGFLFDHQLEHDRELIKETLYNLARYMPNDPNEEGGT